MTDFNSLLKKYITDSNKSIYSLAKEIGIERTLLNKEINGTRSMNKEVFIKLINNLNLTISQQERIIELYNKKALGSEKYETFLAIKNNFVQFSNTLQLKSNKELYLNSSLGETAFVPKYNSNISGAFIVYDVIKNLASEEMKESHPLIYFNFDLLNYDLNTYFEKIYALNNNKINLKNIVTFSLNDSVKKLNFSKFINLLPFLLNGYCAYYTFNNSDITENISLIYPYYLITSKRVILVSSDYQNAVIIDDKSIVSSYIKKFESKISKCNSLHFKKKSVAEMPYILQSTLSNGTVDALLGIDSDICALPFLTKEQYAQMYGKFVPASEIDSLSAEISSYYKKLYESNVTMSFFSPKEAFYKYIDTGISGENRIFLPYEERIGVIKKIREFVAHDRCSYNLYDKNNFFWPEEFFFDVISRTEIVFYDADINSSANNCFYILETPEYLSQELIEFFYDVNKTCYVYSKKRTLEELDAVIKHAEERRHRLQSPNYRVQPLT